MPRSTETIEPRIIERLPNCRDHILRGRFRDAVLKELCDDYDTIIEALEATPAGHEHVGCPDVAYRDLIHLARELEYEILKRLATREEHR